LACFGDEWKSLVLETLSGDGFVADIDEDVSLIVEELIKLSGLPALYRLRAVKRFNNAIIANG
jgi:hypothetical protein